MTVKEQLESFYRFANEQVESDDCDKSLDDLYQEWWSLYRTSDEFRENVVAIQVALDNLDAGAKCRDATEVVKEIRRELNLQQSDDV